MEVVARSDDERLESQQLALLVHLFVREKTLKLGLCSCHGTFCDQLVYMYIRVCVCVFVCVCVCACVWVSRSDLIICVCL